MSHIRSKAARRRARSIAKLENLEVRQLLTTAIASAPFTGAPIVAGQTIEAENFDLGGQGVAYHITTKLDPNNTYRPNDAVDVQTGNPTGYVVGNTVAGEWLQYTITVRTGGNYLVDARISAPAAGGTFHAVFDGKISSAEVAVPKTSAFNDFWTVQSKAVALTAGVHVMRIDLDNNVTGLKMSADFDWFNLTPVAANPVSLVWKAGAPSPVKSFEGMAAMVDGKLYTFGGFSSITPWGVNETAQVYDPSTNVWTNLGAIPIPPTHCGVAADQTTGVIYFVGGYYGAYPGTATSNVYSYDTTTNTWTQLPSMPIAVAAGEAVLIGDNLHYFGGNHGTDRETDFADHYVLNLDDLNAPVTPPPVDPPPVDPPPTDPTPVGPPPTDPTPVNPTPTDPTPVDPTSGDPSPTDPTTGDPSPTDPAPTDPTSGDPAPTDPDPTDPAPTDPAPVDPPPADPPPVDPPPAPVNPWQSAAPLPLARDHASAIVSNGLIYTFGGEIGHEVLHEQQLAGFVYNPATDSWSSLAPCPIPKSHAEASTFVYNNLIVMAGGQADDFKSSGTMLAYDPAADRWSELPALPQALQGTVVQPWNNELIVTTGYDGVTVPQNKTWIAQWPPAPTAPPAPTTPPVTTPTAPVAPAPKPPVTSTTKAYLGASAVVGQQILAVNYDKGGRGVSYTYPFTTNPGGSNYRSDSVGIEAGGSSGHVLGYTVAGETLNYTMNIASAGTYILEASTANPAAGGSFHAEFGTKKTASIAVAKTASWQKYQTVSSASFSLAAGQTVMHIVLDKASINGAVGNFDWFKLVKVG